jgi:hypothetical protein
MVGTSAGWLTRDKARQEALLVDPPPVKVSKPKLGRTVTVKMDEVLYNHLSMIAQGKRMTLAAFMRQLGQDRVRNKKNVNNQLAG